jgi:hypothetical protein
MSSCQKEHIQVSETALEKNAINEIKKIVGLNEEVVVIKKTESDLMNASQTLDLKNSSKRNLTLSEFKDVYESRKVKNVKTVGMFVSANPINLPSDSVVEKLKIKSMDDEEDVEDKPRPAGYYHAMFSFANTYFTNVNQNVRDGGIYNMYLDFNTDASGKIIGTPSISFVGIGFYSWSQINASQITFNPSSTTSTFTITGVNLLGIQIGGVTLGWPSRTNYYFTVDMDEKNSSANVEQN